MKREWKPGDVAMVTWDDASPAARVEGRRDERAEVGIFTGNGWAIRHALSHVHADIADARPLVVIDPEDREQVERLFNLTFERGGGAAALYDALREFANPTPPRPDEPTGLGAVVEDAEGNRYVRHGSPDLDESVTWCDSAGIGRSWARVAAVKVLSEGVVA